MNLPLSLEISFHESKKTDPQKRKRLLNPPGFTPSKHRREVAECAQRPEAQKPDFSTGTLCKKCAEIDFRNPFASSINAESNSVGRFWGENIGNPSTRSSCPLCRFFAIMSPPLPMNLPADVEWSHSALAELDWKKESAFFLKAYSPNEVFRLQGRRQDQNLIPHAPEYTHIDHGILLTVLPTWIGSITGPDKLEEELSAPWNHMQKKPGFILLEGSSPRPNNLYGHRTSSPASGPVREWALLDGPDLDCPNLGRSALSSLSLSRLAFESRAQDLASNRQALPGPQAFPDRLACCDLLAFSGRRISPSAVDFNLVRGWIHYCDMYHDKKCSAATDSVIEGLKVIDCENSAIVNAPRDCVYIALSYVWGSTDSHCASKCSKKLPSSYPPVIKDAIQVVKRLNQRYLWIDRYCIDQEDQAEKHNQIANMDSIYAGAFLTIIAAAGDASSHGLPGVGTTHRIPQPQVQVGEYRLVSSLPDPAQTIGSSKWMSRGWTYQEGLLSRRRLVFTEHQVYFQCANMHCFESMNFPLNELHAEDRAKTNWAFGDEMMFSRVFPPGSVARRAEDYLTRVNEYAKRTLSYDGDALNAILGVLKVFERASPSVYHHWGMPLFHVDSSSADWKNADWITSYALGLTWVLDTVAERRHGLPSWSWVGWKNWNNLSLPLANFSNLSRDAAGRPLFSDIQYSNLDIRIKTRTKTTLHLGYEVLDLEALSTSSMYLDICAWTTTLRLHKNKSSQWELLDQHVTTDKSSGIYLDNSVLVHVTKQIEGEHLWKAILLGYKKVRSSVAEGTIRPTFLIVDEVGECFERVGICSFHMHGGFRERVGEASIGGMKLGRESIILG